MDRHIMQGEVRYLFSELWKGRGEEQRRRETERQRQREKGETEAASSRGRWKRKELRLEAEDQPASVDRRGSGHGLSLKETEQIITGILRLHKAWGHLRTCALFQWFYKRNLKLS